jgi:hypothetical protein
MKYKKPILILALALSLFGAIRLYFHLTDDFRIANISHPMPERPQWDTSLDPSAIEDLKKILNQKYTYIDKGAQVYAFGSADGKYVIKFFKFKHLKPSLFITWLPPIGPLADFKEKNVQRKLRKLEGVFQGHFIAYHFDRQHSGILFLHFNPTPQLGLRTQLVDKIGREYSLDLDPIVFVVQKKGETLRQIFSKILKQGNVSLAAHRAEQILDMYVEEYTHGVWDRDHGISHNTGFIGNEPFHLDVGKFSYDATPQPQAFYKNDLKHVASKIDDYIKEHYPQYYEEFHKLFQEHLDRLSKSLS